MNVMKRAWEIRKQSLRFATHMYTSWVKQCRISMAEALNLAWAEIKKVESDKVKKTKLDGFKKILEANSFKWNGKVYGTLKYGFYVFIDGEKVSISNEEKEGIDALTRKELDELISYKIENNKIKTVGDYIEASSFYGEIAKEFGMPKPVTQF